MKHLYAPWRSNYTENTERATADTSPTDNCAFCTSLQKNDDDGCFILKRFKHTCVMFNRYPYNAGHLLVLPLDHIGHLEHLSKDARCEMMEAANASTIILEKVTRPHGFNIGFNLGKSAGGSIPTHLHMHILPRWTGDTNFLMVLDETKVISTDLSKMFIDLKPLFETIQL